MANHEKKDERKPEEKRETLANKSSTSEKESKDKDSTAVKGSAAKVSTDQGKDKSSTIEKVDVKQTTTTSSSANVEQVQSTPRSSQKSEPVYKSINIRASIVGLLLSKKHQKVNRRIELFIYFSQITLCSVLFFTDKLYESNSTSYIHSYLKVWYVT